MEYNEKQISIMESAERLFAERGFAGTSVRDIVDEARVNIAMVSYYFGSKEKLLESIFKYRGENIRLQLETLVQDQKMSSMEKVFLLIGTYIDRMMERQNFHKIMAREQMVNATGATHKLIHQLKKPTRTWYSA